MLYSDEMAVAGSGLVLLSVQKESCFHCPLECVCVCVGGEDSHYKSQCQAVFGNDGAGKCALAEHINARHVNPGIWDTFVKYVLVSLAFKLSSDNREGVSARIIIIVYYLKRGSRGEKQWLVFVFSIHSLLSSSYWVLLFVWESEIFRAYVEPGHIPRLCEVTEKIYLCVGRIYLPQHGLTAACHQYSL